MKKLKLKDEVDFYILLNYNFNIKNNMIWIGKKFNKDKTAIEIRIDPNTRLLDFAGIPDLFDTIYITLYYLTKDNLLEIVDIKE